MKNKIEKKKVDKLSKIVSILTKTKNTLPVLDCIKCQDGYFTITNLDIEVKIKTDLKESFLVKAKDFLKIIPVMPDFDLEKKDEELIIRREDDEGKLEKFSLHSYDLSTYPSPLKEKYNTFTEKGCGVLNDSDLKKLVISKSFLGKDELRPIMNGVLIYNGEICSTDAHAMYFDSMDIKSKSPFILNKDIIDLVSSLNEDSDPFKISIYYGANYNEKKGVENTDLSQAFIEIKNSEYQIYYRQIHGRYPNYKAVIPQENNIKIVLNKDEFKSIYPKLLLAVNSDNEMSLDVVNKKSTLCTNDLNLNKSYCKEVSSTVSMDDDDFLIKFNLELFNKIINFTQGNDIVLEMSAPNRAVIINHNYLLMPIMKR